MLIFIAVLVLNVWAFFAFWQDKQRAIHARRRTSEKDLLTLAFFGGSVGAIAAQQLFRHKTRKQPFATYLVLIAAGQAGALLGWLSIGSR